MVQVQHQQQLARREHALQELAWQKWMQILQAKVFEWELDSKTTITCRS